LLSWGEDRGFEGNFIEGVDVMNRPWRGIIVNGLVVLGGECIFDFGYSGNWGICERVREVTVLVK
jgi:hypothetical protein